MSWLKNWLTPPTFEGDLEKTAKAKLLHSILLTLLLGVVVLFVTATFFIKANPLQSLVINSVILGSLLGLLLLLQKGYLNFNEHYSDSGASSHTISDSYPYCDWWSAGFSVWH